MKVAHWKIKDPTRARWLVFGHFHFFAADGTPTRVALVEEPTPLAQLWQAGEDRLFAEGWTLQRLDDSPAVHNSP